MHNAQPEKYTLRGWACTSEGLRAFDFTQNPRFELQLQLLPLHKTTQIWSGNERQRQKQREPNRTQTRICARSKQQYSHTARQQNHHPLTLKHILALSIIHAIELLNFRLKLDGCGRAAVRRLNAYQSPSQTIITTILLAKLYSTLTHTKHNPQQTSNNNNNSNININNSTHK